MHASNATAMPDQSGYLHQGSQAYARRADPEYQYKTDAPPSHPPPSPAPPVYQPSPPSQSAPSYRRPEPLRWETADYAPDMVPGAYFSASKELDLDGDLAPLGGKYLRCGVVNG